ncbi:MAG: T9SS type A sorting domain-containing protein [Bacteroidia bacterium]
MKTLVSLFCFILLFINAKGQEIYCADPGLYWSITVQPPYHRAEPITVKNFIYLPEQKKKTTSLKCINLNNSVESTVYRIRGGLNQFQTYNIGSHLIFSLASADSTSFYLIKGNKIIDSTAILGVVPYSYNWVLGSYGVMQLWTKQNHQLYVVDSNLTLTKIQGFKRFSSYVSNNYLFVNSPNSTFLLDENLNRTDISEFPNAWDLVIINDYIYYSNQNIVGSYSIKTKAQKTLVKLKSHEWANLNLTSSTLAFTVEDSVNIKVYTVNESNDAELCKSFTNNEFYAATDALYDNFSANKLKIYDVSTKKLYRKTLSNQVFDNFRYVIYGNRESNEIIFSLNSEQNAQHTFWRFRNGEFRPIGSHNYNPKDSVHIEHIIYANNRYYYIASSIGKTCLYKLNENRHFGKVRSFNDLNGNAIKDSNEYYFSNTVVQIDSNKQILGPFDPVPFNARLKTVKLVGNKNWEPTTDSVFTNSPDTSFAFGLKASQKATNVDGNLALINTRCGFKGLTRLKAINIGNNNISGSMHADFDSLFTIDSFNLKPDSSFNNEFWWYINNIKPGKHSKVIAYISMPGVEQRGKQLKANLSFILNDSIFGDSVYIIDTTRKEITCAYDPNDKTVWPSREEQNLETLFDEYLKYRIRFQNTGNDTAFNIIITDTINQNLDVSTLKILDHSHKMSVEICEKNTVKFIFRDILLPDSFVNEPESHGFVYYKIKAAKGVKENAIVTNKAHIFFDYNPDIITNKTKNLMVSEFTSIGPSSFSSNNIKVYPNPTSGALYIQLKSAETADIKLFNVNGTEIGKSLTDERIHKLHLNDLSPGIYFLHIIQNDSHFFAKVIKE